MSVVRIASALLFASIAIPAFAQSGDSHARVDTAKSHTVIYPKGFETSNEKGIVTLNVGVGSDGLVSHVGVAQTSGYHDLDLAATESAVAWRYVPAMRDGAPHADEITLRVVYDRPDAAEPSGAPAH